MCNGPMKWMLISALMTLVCSHVLAEVRDPTTPLSYVPSVRATSVEPAFVVQSILVSSLRKVAVINGHAIVEGQRIPDTSVTLVKIHAHAVTLSDGKRAWNLALLPNVRQ